MTQHRALGQFVVESSQKKENIMRRIQIVTVVALILP
jgi:hypothetical protein